MNKKTIALIIISTLCIRAIAYNSNSQNDSVHNLTSYVNPFIGTSNFGTTNPGAVCPNGMMSVSPFNVTGSTLNTWDKDSRWWSAPYSSDNCYFTGYAHINLSGVGCPEGGSIITMPTSGDLFVENNLYGSTYTDEKAEPGYYTNRLSKYGIKTEVTATMRTSAERYTFPGGTGHILLDLGCGLTNETGGILRKVSDTEVEGMRFAGTFCYNPQAVFPIYFVMRVSKTPSKSGFWKKQKPMTAEAEWDKFSGKYKLYTAYQREIAGDDIGYWFSFDDLKSGEEIEVQIGVSFVSCENARINLDTEQVGFNFDKVREQAKSLWEKDLSRIKVTGGTDDQKTVFYSALYHTLIHPSVLNDVNGDYPLMEEGPLRTDRSTLVGRVSKGHNRYTIFSLWDTYRNLHQLMSLVFPERQEDMVSSMVDMYKEWGWLPKWELFGRETFTMEGDPAIPVISDTWLKGIKGFDVEAAYDAAVKSSCTQGKDNKMRPDIDPYIEKGYIPIGVYAADFSGDNSVSHALEYYVADYALSLLANDLANNTTDKVRKNEYLKMADVMHKRSLGYVNYYSKESGTLRPITSTGEFLKPFNPKQGENFEPVPGFHEGSAWNYTFYIPHDVENYARIMGGKKVFVNKLQRVFDEGLYDPANEPDIAYPYLFSRFKGEEWRTQKTVTELLAKYFKNTVNGIPGNDDAGTMSAWAVFSMMGFYPDCPGEPYYTLTTPSFDKITISLNPKYCNGKNFLSIEKTPGKIIRSIKIGNKPFGKFRISHKTLIESGKIKFYCK